MDYRSDVSRIDQRLKQIEDSYVNSLANGLWDLNRKQIKLLLAGITQLPDIEFAEVNDRDIFKVSAGSVSTRVNIHREYPVNYLEPSGKVTRLGTLKIVATYDFIFARIMNKIWIILASQAIKTFLISALIIFLIQYLLTRHLNTIVDYTRQVDIDHLNAPLELNRELKEQRNPDELDRVITAFNRMRIKLMRDVRQRKKVERKVSRLNQQLEKKVMQRTSELQKANQELEAFNYTVSHDLQAPLRVITGFSKILAEEHAEHLSTEEQQLLGRILNNCRHMSQLIEDLLSLSMASRKHINLEDINLSEITNARIETLKEQTPERKVQFIVQPQIKARGDKRLLMVVLDNLITNAWKYSSYEENAVIEFGMIHTEMGPTYFVKDNGAGFDMKQYHKLFSVFERLHEASRYRGTGIGLATVQRVIQRHKGEIWAHSEPGQGATFYFTLNSVDKEYQDTRKEA